MPHEVFRADRCLPGRRRRTAAELEAKRAADRAKLRELLADGEWHSTCELLGIVEHEREISRHLADLVYGAGGEPLLLEVRREPHRGGLRNVHWNKSFRIVKGGPRP